MKQRRVTIKEAGHRRLGSINNVDDIPASPGRLEGFRAHLIEEGVAADDVFPGLTTIELPHYDMGVWATADPSHHPSTNRQPPLSTDPKGRKPMSYVLSDAWTWDM